MPVFPRTWEKVSPTVFRLKVPSGWIVKVWPSDPTKCHFLRGRLPAFVVKLDDPSRSWELPEE